MDIIILRNLIALKIKMSTALISHLYRGKLLQHIPFLQLSLIRKAKNISSSKHTEYPDPEVWYTRIDKAYLP